MLWKMLEYLFGKSEYGKYYMTLYMVCLLVVSYAWQIVPIRWLNCEN